MDANSLCQSEILDSEFISHVPVSSNFTLVRSFASPEAATGRVLSKRCSQKFGKFYRKFLCWSLFDKVAALKTCNVIKKRLQHRCFPVKFAKFFRKPILKKICEQDLAVASFSKTTVLRKDYSDKFYFETEKKNRQNKIELMSLYIINFSITTHTYYIIGYYFLNIFAIKSTPYCCVNIMFNIYQAE